MSKTLFSDGNPLQGILGTIVNAAFLNKIFSHRHDGLEQDGSAPLDYAVDTGSANAYAIALTPALTSHIIGLPIHFKAAHASTAPSTLAINGLSPVLMRQSDLSAVTVGTIVANQVVTVIYTGTDYMLVSGRPIATDTEVQGGVNSVKIVTPGGLYNALGALAIKAGFAASLNSNGYLKFPSWLGSILFQWGNATTTGGLVDIVFPITFNNIWQVFGSISSAAFTANIIISIGTLNNSGTRLVASNGVSASAGSVAIRWFAVGN